MRPKGRPFTIISAELMPGYGIHRPETWIVSAAAKNLPCILTVAGFET